MKGRVTTIISVLGLVVAIVMGDWVKAQQQTQTAIEFFGKFNWAVIGLLALEVLLTIGGVWVFAKQPRNDGKHWNILWAFGFGCFGLLIILRDSAPFWRQ